MAIGHGTIVTALTIWLTTAALLLPTPVITAALIGAWYAPGADKLRIEQYLSTAWGVLMLCTMSAFLSRTFMIMGAAGLFAGPHNSWRDQLSALLQSRTVRWTAAGGVAIVALMVVMRFDFGYTRLVLFFGLCGATIAADIFSIRGLSKILRANRSIPYFQGLSEAMKRRTERLWRMRVRPTFPADNATVSPADARRYARRARDIARIHEWCGAGLIVIFSAFVGTALPVMWESNDPLSQIPVLLVLGLVALGFWLQSRGRTYERLAESFEDGSRHRRHSTLNARARRLRRTTGADSIRR